MEEVNSVKVCFLVYYSSCECLLKVEKLVDWFRDNVSYCYLGIIVLCF